jgi:hypothetical protein
MDICIVLQWVTAMNIKKQSGYIFQIAFYMHIAILTDVIIFSVEIRGVIKMKYIA